MTLYAQWDHNFGYYDQLLLGTMRTKKIEYVISNPCPCLISNMRIKLKKKIIAFSSN